MTKLADPREKANGNCSNKAAVQDFDGHGTAVSTLIAARLNGVGIAGVAPQATIVPIKVVNIAGYIFVKSAVAGIRYAADLKLDVINLAFWADPYLFYCKNDAEQRAMLKELQDATTYTQQRGVVIIAQATDTLVDLAHQNYDFISPDYPDNAATIRNITNACLVAPTQLPGVITVSSVGPKPELYGRCAVGMPTIDVTSPGGAMSQYGYYNPLGGVLVGWSSTGNPGGLWDNSVDFTNNPNYTSIAYGLVVEDNGGRYVRLASTGYAAAHVSGVVALIRQMHPGLAPAAVDAILKQTATPLACPVLADSVYLKNYPYNCTGGPTKNSFYGAGIVNAKRAIQK